MQARIQTDRHRLLSSKVHLLQKSKTIGCSSNWEKSTEKIISIRDLRSSLFNNGAEGTLPCLEKLNIIMNLTNGMGLGISTKSFLHPKVVRDTQVAQNYVMKVVKIRLTR